MLLLIIYNRSQIIQKSVDIDHKRPVWTDRKMVHGNLFWINFADGADKELGPRGKSLSDEVGFL